MTNEEKQLLLKDLCARLLYGVKIKTSNGDGILCSIDYIPDGAYLGVSINGAVKEYFEYQDAKPYLRPMSSMTDSEYKEYDNATDLDVADSSETLKENLAAKSRVRVSKWYHGTDWLNAHHFDYRGLIEKGLALEAPEGMYKL